MRVGDWDHPARSFDAEIVASALALEGAKTVANRVLAHLDEVARVPSAFFDALYFPDPTPLGQVRTAFADRMDCATAPAFATGAHMLAHQAARQVELMCGVEAAPAEGMYEAVFGVGI